MEPFFFHPLMLGDPPHKTGLITPLYHPLLLRSPSLQVRNCGLQIAAQFCYYSPMEGLRSGRGGDGPLPSPVFGTYNRGGRRSTAPCVRFCIAQGGKTLDRPLFLVSYKI